MTEAVNVRRDGDAFQARIFWTYAGKLLDEESNVSRVGFESGPKGFDDVWVEYKSGRGHRDREGNILQREHFQCKWHVSPGSFGHVDLTLADFLHAKSFSFLQRAHQAQKAYAPDGRGSRLALLTNWRISQEDPLVAMICQRSTALRPDRLFDGTVRDTSKTGAVRKLWREHLNIEDDELRLLAGTIGIGSASDSLDGMRNNLDNLFGRVGLRRVPEHQSTFVYDDIPFQWAGQKRLEFEPKSFREICASEGLLVSERVIPPKTYGVKSFLHPIDPIEQRCTEVLNLIPHFEDRFINDDADWLNTIYPELSAFLINGAREADKLRLVFDAHTSLSFAAGSILDIKSGKEIEIEQRGRKGREIWSANDHPAAPTWPELNFVETALDDGQDLAVAVGLTHDISAAVEAYVHQEISDVGRLLACKVNTGPGQTSIACGHHAFLLVDALLSRVRAIRLNRPFKRIHLFVAAPNVFSYFLGQRRPALGPTTLYEYDLEGVRTGSYKPSLSLPV